MQNLPHPTEQYGVVYSLAQLLAALARHFYQEKLLQLHLLFFFPQKKALGHFSLGIPLPREHCGLASGDVVQILDYPLGDSFHACGE